MNCTIDAIQVQNFRGIRRLSLPVEGHNLVIVGENGSGKSSIVDAIEYFFTGQVEPLEGRADVDKRQSIPNSQGGETAVSLTLRGMSPKAGIKLPYPRRDAAIPISLKPICELARRRAFVLRRSQVLTFINARDAERYREISQLIGLGQLDQMDQTWRKQWKAAQDRVDKLCQDQKDIRDRLGQLLDTEIQTESDITQAINAHLAGMAQSPIGGRHDLKARREALEESVLLARKSSGLGALLAVQDSIEAVSQKIEEISFQCGALDQSWQRFRTESEGLNDALFEQLLMQGHQILTEKADIEDCPLCEAPIRDREALVSRIGERLATLHDLTSSRKQIGNLETAIQGNLLLLGEALNVLQLSLEDCEMAEHLPTIQEAQVQIRRQRQVLQASSRPLHATQEWQVGGAIAELLRILTEVRAGIARQVDARSPTETEKSKLDDLTLLSRIDEQWQMLQNKAVEIARARYVAQQISLVYDALIAARKRGLERIRHELEEDFDRFYQQLHPDEGYQSITIPVQQAQRSSIALRAGFHDQKEAHPLSYYSEGHLDSLGLCIFLAFIKRFNQDLKLIVMDDVLTTVDAGHRLRVARLLAREFDDYQLVLTTHDPLWAKELDSILPNSQVMQLRRWKLGQGVDCQQNVLSDWDYYEEQAQSGHPQDTIAGAGRNLEKFLFQMRGNLGLAVPAKPDRDYTIGDLYGPFWKWVKGHPLERPDVPDFDQELADIRQELDEVWRLRNWSGAHFNAWGETVTPQEALSFLGAIRSLVSLFECPICCNLVLYGRQARALYCPRCQPSPPPRVVWEYKAAWHATAERLLQKTRTKQHAVTMTQRVFRRFLRDMRRRLSLPIQANPDDEYELADLYGPFFAWTTAHPRAGMPDWQSEIEKQKGVIDDCLEEGQWKQILDTEMASFVNAVHHLTRLFECNACSQLLDYDHKDARYLCTECTGQVKHPSQVPALWYVKGT